MNEYSDVKNKLLRSPKVWLVTGVAGFIGSNLLETLLKLNQTVVGLDNFATGHWQNLKEVKLNVHEEQWEKFYFFEGDIRNLEDCEKAMSVTINGELHRVDFVLHQAALGSVPRSINDPITTNDTNVSGFLNMLVAAKNAEVSSFTYAASSSTYGDHPGLPKHEHLIGKPLSPYAVTKYVNELYADVFFKAYAFNSIGLRYFNVFGRRQDPYGAYAAVIPTWANAIISGDDVYINGDGETSRDFCYIENTVQANILAAVATKADALNQVYNVAVGDNTSLNDLFFLIRDFLVSSGISYDKDPIYREQRKGDVRHSLACIDKARNLLGYHPDFNITQGLEQAMDWYVQQQR